MRLTAKGCDRTSILENLVHLVRDAPKIDSWRGIVGMEPRHPKSALKRIRNCADKVEQINSQPISHFLLFSVPDNIYRDFLRIPELLRAYTKALQHCLKHIRPKAGHARLGAQMALVQHVKKKTGSWHDKEVAALISAVLDKDGYIAGNLKSWRSQPQKRISRSFLKSRPKLSSE